MNTMNILDYMQEHLLYLDGGMGTLLQEAGLAPGEYPERWTLCLLYTSDAADD